MTKEEREELIALLILWTGRDMKAFEGKTDKELLREYDRQKG